MVLESFPKCFSSVDLTRTHSFFPNSVRLWFDLVASLFFLDFDRTADSDGIPPMKAFPQCRFGWDSSDEGEIRAGRDTQRRGEIRAGRGRHDAYVMEWMNTIYWSLIRGLNYGSKPFWCSSTPRVRGCSSRYLSGHISGAQSNQNSQYLARQRAVRHHKTRSVMWHRVAFRVPCG